MAWPKDKKFSYAPGEMDRRTKQCTEEEVIKAVHQWKGKLYLVAASLKISYQTLRNYAKDSYPIREAIAEAKGRLLDVTEGKLYKAVDDNEPWAIMFLLKTQGKKRGYSERVEQAHSGKMEINNSNKRMALEQLNLPIEARKAIVEAIRKRRAEIEQEDNKPKKLEHRKEGK